MSWHCAKCGADSTKCYRCSECGADLASSDSKTEGAFDE